MHAHWRSLKRAKMEICCRLLGDCRKAACAAMLLTAVTLGTIGGGLFNSLIKGTDRFNLNKGFGGAAEVLCCFLKWGWWSLEPVDIIYGNNLSHEENRRYLLNRIKQLKRRLAIISSVHSVQSAHKLVLPDSSGQTQT